MVLLHAAPTPLPKHFTPVPKPEENRGGGRVSTKKRPLPGRAEQSSQPPSTDSVGPGLRLPVLRAALVQTHLKSSCLAGSCVREPPTVLPVPRGVPQPSPPHAPGAALPYARPLPAFGESGRVGAPRGAPASARTWLGRGDPSGAQPRRGAGATATAVQVSEVGGRGRRGPAPRCCWGPGAPLWGSSAVPPLGPARAVGTGESGGGVLSPPKGEGGPGPAWATRADIPHSRSWSPPHLPHLLRPAAAARARREGLL